MKQCEFEEMYNQYIQNRNYISKNYTDIYRMQNLRKKCYKDFFYKIKDIDGIEENVKKYLEDAHKKQEWKISYQNIFSLVLDLNSEIFIPILVSIAKGTYENCPVYQALDALMYIKCNVSEEVIQEICDTITKNADHWNVETIEIALQIFAWIDTEVGYEYLKNNRNNSNKIVAHYANHWYNFLQDDEDDDE